MWRHTVLAFSMGALLLVACSATPGTPGSGGGTQTGPGVTTAQGAGGATQASTGTLGGFTAASASGSGGGTIDCVPCSADLHTALNCDGTIKQQCNPDQACAGGQCINNPCEAARLSQSTYGCDYWTLNLDAIIQPDQNTGKQFGAGSCYAAFVANTWTKPVKIQVERAGQSLNIAQFARIPKGQGQLLTYDTYDTATGLPPGEVAILFLAYSPQAVNACPAGVTPAVLQDTGVKGTGRGQAFHITTDLPIVAYQIFPYGGGNTAATSATLLLPTSAWDVNYVVVNAYDFVIMGLPIPPIVVDINSLDIVAAEDGTEVTINPVKAIVAGPAVPGTLAGQSIMYPLSRGEYVQISQQDELTGSVIASNKPVGLFGGATCMNVPNTKSACDTAQQQIPPVKALGHEYVAVRYRGRAGFTTENVPWRLVGMIDGTTLTYEPAPPPGAPATLNRGDRPEFWSAEPFVVRSQDKDHPFYLAAYMTGGGPTSPFGIDFSPSTNGEGDPEWVNVVPGGQYLDSYVFFTDPTYPETNLVVVRPRMKNGQFADVTLDCMGTLSGWQPVGANYEYTRVDLVTGNFQNVGSCSNGRHTLSSQAPVGLTVWGWGSAVTGGLNLGDLGYTQYCSYAYPAGMSVRPINQVEIPVPPPN